ESCAKAAVRRVSVDSSVAANPDPFGRLEDGPPRGAVLLRCIPQPALTSAKTSRYRDSITWCTNGLLLVRTSVFAAQTRFSSHHVQHDQHSHHHKRDQCRRTHFRLLLLLKLTDHRLRRTRDRSSPRRDRNRRCTVLGINKAQVDTRACRNPSRRRPRPTDGVWCATCRHEFGELLRCWFQNGPSASASRP